MNRNVLLFATCIFLSQLVFSQDAETLRKKQVRDSLNNLKAKETEYYTPVPPVINPGKAYGDIPSDAIVLFDGKNLNEWASSKNPLQPAKWTVADGIVTVNKKEGDIQTKRNFTDYQLHIEYRIPTTIKETGQSRGNSGIFLATLPSGSGYELQVLDNYQNTTYVNGQAASIYKQSPPLVNACRPPGEWQTFDVIWIAPRFNENKILTSLARVTVFHNGVLVQNNTVILGDTPYIGHPAYTFHGPLPIKLQSHDDPSDPISFRNIWVREL